MARKSTRRIRPMVYPLSHEIMYRKLLLNHVRQMRISLRKHLLPIIPKLVKEAVDISLPSGDIIQDAEGWSDELNDALENVANDMTRSSRITIEESRKIGLDTNKFNLREWRGLIKREYGVDPVAENPQLYSQLLRNWSDTNARLISDIPAKTIRQIREQITEALQTGRTIADTAAAIKDIMEERMDVSDSRAELIARDQTAKLNGQLTEERQAEIGVEQYIWRTVGDERVRDDHKDCDGETFDWDGSSSLNGVSKPDGNDPGEDFQCRCWAEPILPERLQFEASLIEQEALI